MGNQAAAKSKPAKRPTRKQRKDLGRRIWSERPGLEVVHRDAAGIDIGSRNHYVAVGSDRDQELVRVFGCFTAELRRMAEWLKQRGIRTVVMQSTGVYWIPVYDVLEEAGFDVWLANAQQTKNLPGRKSDVQESQWLLKLHTFGLLGKSFRPPAEIRALRSCWRERNEYVQLAGACILRVQKALTEMNIQLPTVVKDLGGVTGMKILRSIVAGERDGARLAEFRDPRIKASQEEIAKSLEGTWRPEQVAILKRRLEDWDHLQKQMTACDQDLQAMMKQLPTTAEFDLPGMGRQTVQFAFAALGLLLDDGHASAIHLEIKDGDEFTENDRQIQLDGAIDLLLLASCDVLADRFGHSFDDLAVTFRPASNSICSRP